MNELFFYLDEELRTSQRYEGAFKGTSKIISMPFCSYMRICVPLGDIFDYEHTPLSDIVCPYIRFLEFTTRWNKNLDASSSVVRYTKKVAEEENNGTTLMELLGVDSLEAQMQLLVWYREYLQKLGKNTDRADRYINKLFFDEAMRKMAKRAYYEDKLLWRDREVCSAAWKRYQCHEDNNVPTGNFCALCRQVETEYPTIVYDVHYERKFEEGRLGEDLEANRLLMSDVIDYYWIEPEKPETIDNYTWVGPIAFGVVAYIIIRTILSFFGC